MEFLIFLGSSVPIVLALMDPLLRMDFTLTSRELLAAIRGKRSQLAISRQLGYRSNQFYKWESGLSDIPWSDFVRLTEVLRLPLQAAFQFSIFQGDFIKSPPLLLRQLIGDKASVQELRLWKISRHQIGRWLRGDGEPRLKDVLFVIELRFTALVEFVESLVPIERLPSLTLLHRQKQLEKEIQCRLPWVGALLRAVECTDYRDAPGSGVGTLSKRLKIKTLEIQKALEELEMAGLIQKADSGKFETKNPWLNVSSSKSFEITKNNLNYWGNRIQKYLTHATGKNKNAILGYRVLGCGPKDHEKIVNAYVEFWGKVSMIIKESTEPTERVVCFATQIVDITELPE